jgi:hypothetical protein
MSFTALLAAALSFQIASAQTKELIFNLTLPSLKGMYVADVGWATSTSLTSLGTPFVGGSQSRPLSSITNNYPGSAVYIERNPNAMGSTSLTVNSETAIVGSGDEGPGGNRFIDNMLHIPAAGFAKQRVFLETSGIKGETKTTPDGRWGFGSMIFTTAIHTEV